MKSLHLILRNLGNRLGDFGVVDAAAEGFGTGTDGKDGDVAVGVAARGPADVSVGAHTLFGAGSEQTFRGIEAFGRLVRAVHHSLVGIAEGFFFLLGNLDVLPKTKVFLQIAAHQFPRESRSLLLAELLEVGAVLVAAHALQTEVAGVEGIVARTETEAAGFVVGGDQDERLVGVLLVEFISHADGLIGVDDLAHHGRGAVGMARPVDLSALNHAEEAVGIFLLQKSDGSAGDFG